MNRSKKFFILLLLVGVTFVAAGQTVQACVCPTRDNSTLGKFESARYVVVARFASFDKEPNVRARMIVEKVYKGDLNAGEEMIFGQGGSDCRVEFREGEVGTKFLFFLEPGEHKPKLWYADSCGRSQPLPNQTTRYIQDAANDLLYLDKMTEVRGRTRISGTLISYQWSIARGGADFKKVAAAKVQIIGDGRSYEAITNEDGVYEIYDLPVGTYVVKPVVKQGWKIDVGSAFGGFSSGRNNVDGSSRISLKAGRHAYSDSFLKVDNRVSGTVVDASGRPLRSVYVRLVPTQTDVSPYFNGDGSTDADGRFDIEEIPFASYVVVINPDDKISSHQPFRRFYYPNVADRAKAEVITVVEGETKYELDVRVPAVKEVVSVAGKVLSADGKPVVFAHVVFVSEQTDATLEGGAFATTDQQGNFSMNVLKDLSGKLFAVVWLDLIEFKNCPAVLRVGGEVSLDRKTDAIRLQADRSMDGVELKLPFPSCKGEKIVSQMRID